MRKKELYLTEGKIPALGLVGCDTTTLCWERKNRRSCYSSLSWLLIEDVNISYASPDLLPPLVFLKGKIQRADFSTSWTCAWSSPRALPGDVGDCWAQCCQDSLCTVEGCVVKNLCEIAQLALKKLLLKRYRGTKFRNWAVGGTTPSTHIVCFPSAGATCLGNVMVLWSEFITRGSFCV